MTSFFQIDLGLSRQALLSKKFIADHKELDPTMSSIELNMRVCLSVESGEFNNARENAQEKNSVASSIVKTVVDEM